MKVKEFRLFFSVIFLCALSLAGQVALAIPRIDYKFFMDNRVMYMGDSSEYESDRQAAMTDGSAELVAVVKEQGFLRQPEIDYLWIRRLQSERGTFYDFIRMATPSEIELVAGGRGSCARYLDTQ